MDIIISLLAGFLLMDLVTILSALTTIQASGNSSPKQSETKHIGRLMIGLSRSQDAGGWELIETSHKHYTILYYQLKTHPNLYYLIK